MNSEKFTICWAIFLIAVAATACGIGDKERADTPLADAGTNADLSQQAICWELTPEECQNYADPKMGPCFLEFLTPFDRERACYEDTERPLCLPFESQGDTAEIIVVDPKGVCYWNAATIYDGLPPGWEYEPAPDCSCEVDADGDFIEGCQVNGIDFVPCE